MDLYKMQLPKVNERRQQSKIKQNALKIELMKTIQEFEKQKKIWHTQKEFGKFIH